MRIDIDIEDQLLEEALSFSNVKTKQELIDDALREYIRLRKRKDMAELAGLISFDDDFDHKQMREIRG